MANYQLINEALSLAETDLDRRRGSILVRHGKNDRRRQVGMDAWAWTAIEPSLADRLVLRVELRHLARKAGVRRQFAPHQLRHAHAVELMHKRIPLPLIERPLAPVNDRHLPGRHYHEEIISAVHARRAPTMHAGAGLAL